MCALPRPRSFSLRTLLVVVAGLCILCAWVAWQRNIVVDRRTTIKALGDEIFVRDVSSLRSLYPALNPPNEDPAALASVPWIRRALGDAAIQQILVPLEWSDARIRELKLQFPEATVTKSDALGATALEAYDDYLRSRRPAAVSPSGLPALPAP